MDRNDDDDARKRQDEKLDKILAGLDSVNRRMDTYEARERDREAADGARRKADDDARKRAARDAAADAAHCVAMNNAAEEADKVFRTFGSQVPAWRQDERVQDYERRMCNELKKYSKRWKDVELNTVADGALPIAKSQIYADATAEGLYPTIVPPNALVERTRHTDGGAKMLEFYGQPSVWMSAFRGNRQRLVKRPGVGYFDTQRLH